MPTPHPRPWHRGSVFGDGHRVPMCRERRAQWRARLTLFRRAKKLTPLHEDIGLALLKRLGTNGRLDPSHETLADDAGCDERSVRRALVAFRSFGLLHWVQRVARDGWRTTQITNSYALALGDPPQIPAPRCGGQSGRETSKSSFYPTVTAFPASPAEVVAAQRALLERQRVIAGRMLTRGRGFAAATS